MSASTYGDSSALLGSTLPILWRSGAHRSRFGDIAVLAFLLTQLFDGVFTYVGVTSFGVGIEGNPVMAQLMLLLGYGPALLLAKLAAAALGIVLHLGRVHGAVAFLAGFYLVAAVLPWAAILLV
jgi:hypothetical protein